MRRYPHLRMVFSILILSALFLSATGCRKKQGAITQKEARTVVGKIRFEGVTYFEEADLRKYLLIRVNSAWAGLGLSDTSYLVKGRIQLDKKTIVEAYRLAGFFDARVTEVRLENRRPGSSKVTLTFVVDEGEPIAVEEVEFRWKRSIAEEQVVIDKVSIVAGEPADVARLNDSRDQVSQTLHDFGFALSAVKESMVIMPDEGIARVRFEIDPGPLCTIGDITLEGLDDVPKDLVHRELEPFKGELYTPATKKKIENRLLSMGVFSVASVAPNPQVSEDGTLGLTASFLERNPQTLKFSIGVLFDPNKNMGHVTALYNHRNLFKRLYRFQLKTLAGWAVVPQFWNTDSHGPVARIEPKLTKKGFLERELVWTLRTSFTADVDPDYQYFTPQAQLSVSRFFFTRTLASLSYNFEYYVVYKVMERWIEMMEEENSGIRSPYRLGYLEARYLVRATDRRVDPRNGAVFQIRYAFSARALGSEAQYNRLHPSIKLYWQMIPRLQVVTRAETGFLFPFGETADTTMWSNFFLGGAGTMRGWGSKKLAPKYEACIDEDDCDSIQIGGKTMVLGNVELRLRTFKKLYVVAFLDVGDVQYNVFTFKPERWNYSTGGGLRYDTPMGRIRVDIGYRINNPEPYADLSRWGIHLGMGEAF